MAKKPATAKKSAPAPAKGKPPMKAGYGKGKK